VIGSISQQNNWVYIPRMRNGGRTKRDNAD